MAISGSTSFDLNALSVRAVKGFKNTVLRWRKILVPIGLFVLIAGGIWAVRTSEIKLSDLQFGPLLILLLAFPLINVVYGVFGLQILGNMAPNKPKIEFWSAFKITSIAEVSQILPIPAASAMRAGVLVDKGVSVGYSSVLVVLSVAIWMSLALFLAGWAIAYGGNNQGFVPLVIGLLVCVPVLVWTHKKAGPRMTLVFLIHKIAGLVITAARMFAAFAALDVILSPASSFVFSLAVIAGSTAAITPAGVGISEVLGSVLSGATSISASVAFLAIAVDRFASMLGFALIAGITLLFPASKPAKVK